MTSGWFPQEVELFILKVNTNFDYRIAIISLIVVYNNTLIKFFVVKFKMCQQISYNTNISHKTCFIS